MQLSWFVMDHMMQPREMSCESLSRNRIIPGLHQNNHKLSHIHLSLCEPFPLGCSSLLAFSAPEAFSSTIFVKTSPISHSQGVPNKLKISHHNCLLYYLHLRNLCCQLVDRKSSSQMRLKRISTSTLCLCVGPKE